MATNADTLKDTNAETLLKHLGLTLDNLNGAQPERCLSDPQEQECADDTRKVFETLARLNAEAMQHLGECSHWCAKTDTAGSLLVDMGALLAMVLK